MRAAVVTVIFRLGMSLASVLPAVRMIMRVCRSSAGFSACGKGFFRGVRGFLPTGVVTVVVVAVVVAVVAVVAVVVVTVVVVVVVIVVVVVVAVCGVFGVFFSLGAALFLYRLLVESVVGVVVSSEVGWCCGVATWPGE